MKKGVLLASLVAIGLMGVGCSAPQPEQDTTVKTVKKLVINNQTVRMIVEEHADRSIVDSGSASRLPAQKYTSVGDFFGSYNMLKNNKGIVLSKYNITPDKAVSSSDIWFFGKNGKVRLTNTSYFNLYPSMSVDEAYVYFVSNRGKIALSNYDQTTYIWRMSSKGNGGLTRIGTAMNSIYNPLESPDGKKLLYSAKEFGGQDTMIWYMGRNGELPTQLKKGKQASWLDNDTIVFTAKDPGTGLYAIWRMNLDGSEMTQIIADKNLHCIQPAASFDQKHIAFVKQNGSQPDQRDIYIYDVETGLVDQMTTNSSRDDLPRWSEDNKYIYFRSSRGLSWNVWRIQTELK